MIQNHIDSSGSIHCAIVHHSEPFVRDMLALFSPTHLRDIQTSDYAPSSHFSFHDFNLTNGAHGFHVSFRQSEALPQLVHVFQPGAWTGQGFA